MSRNLYKALKVQKQSTEQVSPIIEGSLGIPLGGQKLVEVPSRNSFVYVRLRDNQNEVIQAFNNKVAPSYNLPVLIKREGNRYIVFGVNTQRYQNNWNSFAPYLARHGNTHSFDSDMGGGGDVTWVHTRQFMPLLTMPSGSVGGPNIVLAGYTMRNELDNTWRYLGNTGTQSLLQFVPTGSSAVMVLVYLDLVTGNPGIIVNSGSYFPNNITGTPQIVPYIPQISNPNWIPDSAIRLVSGTSLIGWDNIYDVRQFLRHNPTGTSLFIQSEGIDLGTAGALNFVGSNYEVSISGTIARVFITGGTGGGSVPTLLSGSVALADENGLLTSKPWLKYNNSDETVIFGADKVKEENAGKIGYQSFGPYFYLIGAGTGVPRTVFIFDDLGIAETLLVPRISGSILHLDGQGVIPLVLKNNTIDTFYVDISGTAHSNGTPLIKEAPINENMYMRYNAGWEPFNGWIPSPQTWTFLRADAPSYEIYAASNVTGTIGLGYKFRLNHLGQNKNFFVTAIGITGSTTYLNLYGGTDYTLTTGTISNPYYSNIKAPFGFPLSPTKWTVAASDTSTRTKTSPTNNTWYGETNAMDSSESLPDIAIPIGVWNVTYNALVRGQVPAASSNFIRIEVALSTSGSSASDNDLVAANSLNAGGDGSGNLVTVSILRNFPKVLELTSKTNYYLLARVQVTTSPTSLQVQGATSTTTIRAVCAFL